MLQARAGLTIPANWAKKNANMRGTNSIRTVTAATRRKIRVMGKAMIVMTN